MSDVVDGGLSVLLPDATIDIFSINTDTKDEILSLKDDWRYARVEVNAYHGSVEQAKAYYSQNNSPSLLIIETDEIGEDFVDSLEGLAGCCNEGTSAVIIGPVNDISLYRKLVGMGVSDYLVRPIDTKGVSDIFAKTLIEKLGVSESKLITVIGAKGGVGVSSISYALAEASSDILKQKTIILDAAGGWSYLARAMTNNEPIATLKDVASMVQKNNDQGLDRVIVEVNDKLSVLSTGADDMLEKAISHDEFEAVINNFMVNYPVVIVDASQADPLLKKILLRKAHKVIAVTNASLPSLRSAKSLLSNIDILKGGEDDNVELVVNLKSFLGNNDVPQADVDLVLDKKSALNIDYNPKIWGEIEVRTCKFADVKGGADILNKVVSLVDDVISSNRLETQSNKKGLLSIIGKISGN